MITVIEKDIFTAEVDAIVHGCNIHCTFGSGIALTIKNKFPSAYIADCETEKDDIDKLGTFSYAEVLPKYYVFNLYQQTLYGKFDRNLDYDAFYNSLYSAKNKMEQLKLTKIAMPYNIGCDRAKGDWRIVSKMIDVIFENSNIDVEICKFNPK